MMTTTLMYVKNVKKMTTYPQYLLLVGSEKRSIILIEFICITRNISIIDAVQRKSLN